MFCRKCGSIVPEDSQFCSKCGQSVTVASSSTGAAAAVAPARIPTPTPQSKPSRNVAGWVLASVLLILIGIWAVDHVKQTTGQPLPSQATQPRLQTQSTGNVAV